jgi:hypothetical protein
MAEPTSSPKTRVGDKVKIKKQISIDKGNKYVLSVGETFTAEGVTPTGAIRITKQFSTGELKKAMVSKEYYDKV